MLPDTESLGVARELCFPCFKFCIYFYRVVCNSSIVFRSVEKISCILVMVSISIQFNSLFQSLFLCCVIFGNPPGCVIVSELAFAVIIRVLARKIALPCSFVSSWRYLGLVSFSFLCTCFQEYYILILSVLVALYFMSYSSNMFSLFF